MQSSNQGWSRSGGEARHLPLEDNENLRDALTQSDLPSLLMTYAHLSGDQEILARFQPHIHSITSGQMTDIPSELADELREKMRLFLTQSDDQLPPIPPTQHLQNIMTTGMGEPVAAEFIPLLLEQSGLGGQVDRSKRAARQKQPSQVKVLVIGAGISGLAAGIKLAETGYDFEIIEKLPEVGGTWFTARYPGAGVDTPSHFYSFSFAQNPNWSTYTPKGPEMRDYLIAVSHQFGLRDRIRFNHRVESLRWDAVRGLWHASVIRPDGTEQTISAHAVINAHGRLSRWQFPDIMGRDSFSGQMLHTADWDDELDLRGKRVAMIGTGASAAQCGPAIAGQVASLTVFQRSGHWVVPNATAGAPVAPAVQWAMQNIPYYLEWFRFGIYWTGSDGLYSNLIKDPEWPADSPSVSQENEYLRQYCLCNMNNKLAGRPDLIEKLTPNSPVFSKRIVMDTDWLRMFMKDNVALETSAIAEITADGIKMADGNFHAVDVIIFATGYNVSRMAGFMDVIGEGERNIQDEWGEEDPQAYLGLMIPNFPNYFHILGPNSAPNHGAGVNLVAETQINYIVESLDYLLENGAKAMAPTQAAHDAFQDRVQSQMPKMIWTHPLANSYYRNSKGRVIGSWPFRLLDYWSETRAPHWPDFALQQGDFTPLAVQPVAGANAA
ncbi:flavin-containing monooxygenase [Sphingopyxis yananensis]|uniref:flavin-containing monooxygenase n=1 Tax=Sphingopyxis yananensis TaxID=2886687 RepID=UPI001D125023|nr:NAD(P)/FAD-dependent oxidoreductase [Sphingopyxis yananensis]MCC2603139.1 NAD(P)/FAD-dependent oxidoreductase [Sphingopyxis yananensis]